MVGLWVVVAVLCGVLGAVIGDGKGRAVAGFWIGLLLGPIGLIIAAVLPPSDEVQLQRNQQLAGAIIGAVGTSAAADPRAQRREAMAEAIRRDPTLSQATTSEELARLSEATRLIQEELELREDLAAVTSGELDEDKLEAAFVAGELMGLNLAEMDLSYFDLAFADATGANFTGANLEKAVLHDADLTNAVLAEADLTGTDLSGAELTGADLSGARLAGTKLWGVTYSSTTKWPEGFEPPPSAAP